MRFLVGKVRFTKKLRSIDFLGNNELIAYFVYIEFLRIYSECLREYIECMRGYIKCKRK